MSDDAQNCRLLTSLSGSMIMSAFWKFGLKRYRNANDRLESQLSMSVCLHSTRPGISQIPEAMEGREAGLYGACWLL